MSDVDVDPPLAEFFKGSTWHKWHLDQEGTLKVTLL